MFLHLACLGKVSSSCCVSCVVEYPQEKTERYKRIRLGMLSRSLEQIILNPNMEIAHAIILIHLIVVAAYLPNYIDTQEAIAKTISYFV